MANTNQKTAETGQIAAEQFRAAFGDINERAKAAAEKSAKMRRRAADLTRGNVEAFVASSKIAAKGVESMSQDAAEYSRKSFEEASAVLKSFAEVKSATDFFRLQGDYRPQRVRCRRRRERPRQRDRAEAGRRSRRADQQPLHRRGRAREDPGRVTRSRVRTGKRAAPPFGAAALFFGS